MPLATVAVTVALGLVASLALRRPEFTDRPEWRLGVGLAAAAGVALGLLVEVLGAALGGLDTGAGPNHYLMVLPFAVAAGGVGFLAGLAGYWLAARVATAVRRPSAPWPARSSSSRPTCWRRAWGRRARGSSQDGVTRAGDRRAS